MQGDYTSSEEDAVRNDNQLLQPISSNPCPQDLENHQTISI